MNYKLAKAQFQQLLDDASLINQKDFSIHYSDITDLITRCKALLFHFYANNGIAHNFNSFLNDIEFSNEINVNRSVAIINLVKNILNDIALKEADSITEIDNLRTENKTLKHALEDKPLQIEGTIYRNSFFVLLFLNYTAIIFGVPFYFEWYNWFAIVFLEFSGVVCFAIAYFRKVSEKALFVVGLVFAIISTLITILQWQPNFH